MKRKTVCRTEQVLVENSLESGPDTTWNYTLLRVRLILTYSMQLWANLTFTLQARLKRVSQRDTELV